MSAHVCPNCGRRGFTWTVDEERDAPTQWHCSLCRYVAAEDETRALTCPACGTAEGRLLLAGPEGTFRFCVHCQSRTPDTESGGATERGGTSA
jgi:RNA polymerase subunit RPABC4/transcription elongation factor Spt4